MAAKPTPYPTYRDSRIEWLGEVPAHWPVERLKCSLANIVEQAAELPRIGTVVALENVESWTGRVALANSGPSFDSQLKRFRSGDVLFGKLRPYLAKVARFTSDGLCVGEFLVLRPRNGSVMGAYFEHLLRSKPIIDAVTASTFGAKMPRADWQFIGGMPVVRPPLPEQAAIVRFLDHADRRIRRYIRAEQKLIALLEEQQRALVHDAVTGRIDVRTGRPYPAYKSSGVAWLATVPAHWRVLPLKRAFLSMDYGISDTGTDEGTIPVLTMGDIGRDGTVTVPESGGLTSVSPRLLLQDRDLLFNRTNGSAELVGKVGLFRPHGRVATFASYLVRLRARPENRPEFLNSLLNDADFLVCRPG